jgi:pyrimidine operon attenuation protein/uracil phosphoribosyltransferase
LKKKELSRVLINGINLEGHRIAWTEIFQIKHIKCIEIRLIIHTLEDTIKENEPEPILRRMDMKILKKKRVLLIYDYYCWNIRALGKLSITKQNFYRKENIRENTIYY